MTDRTLFYFFLGLFYKQPITYREILGVFIETKEGSEWKKKKDYRSVEANKTIGMLMRVLGDVHGI
jgi:hypothetical protein